MKVLIVCFTILIIISGCTEKIIEAVPEYYNLSGRIIKLKESDNRSGIVVELAGEGIHHDTTDASGFYMFKEIKKGSYHIHINDPEYPGIDTAVIINSDTVINIKYRNYLSGFIVSGNITTLSETEDKSGIIIELTGNTTSYTDTLDSAGNYWIERVDEGSYKIAVNDERYSGIDTSVIVKSDTVINIMYENFLTLYTISGNIVTLNDDEDKSNIEIQLSGELYKTNLTDESGNFQFVKIPEGDYQIKVKDTRYFDIDSSISVSSDASITIDYNIYFHKYFSFEIGNVWNYQFEYKVHMISPDSIKGSLSWELVDILDTRDSTTYVFSENVNAIYYHYHTNFDSLGWFIDSTYEINESGEFIFVCNNSKYINQLTDNFISGYGSIGLNKYQIIFPDSADEQEIGYGGIGMAQTDREGHRIILGKNIGIKSWRVWASHHGGPFLNMRLMDYYFPKPNK